MAYPLGTTVQKGMLIPMIRVLIRADASSEIGIGHLMRCLVLAELLSDAGMNVTFLCRALSGALNALVVGSGFELLRVSAHTADTELDELVGHIRTMQTDLLVIDRYGIDITFERHVQQLTGVRLLVIDDIYSRHHADILLNPNIYADPACYEGLLPDSCLLLCGLRYALVRKEFRVAGRSANRQGTQVPFRVLVTMGGADPDNITSAVIAALGSIDVPAMIVSVVVGPVSHHRDDVKTATAKLNQHVTIINNADNMAQLMRNSDCVITSSGGTFIETLFCEVPALLINIASNQDISYAYAKSNKIAYIVETDKLIYSLQSAIRDIIAQTDTYRTIMLNRQQSLKDALDTDLAGLVGRTLRAHCTS